MPAQALYFGLFMLFVILALCISFARLLARKQQALRDEHNDIFEENP